jgi:hypothetical protein
MSIQSSLVLRFSVVNIIQISHFLKSVCIYARYVIVNLK